MSVREMLVKLLGEPEWSEAKSGHAQWHRGAVDLFYNKFGKACVDVCGNYVVYGDVHLCEHKTPITEDHLRAAFLLCGIETKEPSCPNN